MFDSEQNVTTETTDKRILPTEGIISINQLCLYLIPYDPYCSLNMERFKRDRKNLAEELQKNHIPIIKIGEDTAQWIVRLEDIKPS